MDEVVLNVHSVIMKKGHVIIFRNTFSITSLPSGVLNTASLVVGLIATKLCWK